MPTPTKFDVGQPAPTQKFAFVTPGGTTSKRRPPRRYRTTAVVTASPKKTFEEEQPCGVMKEANLLSPFFGGCSYRYPLVPTTQTAKDPLTMALASVKDVTLRLKRALERPDIDPGLARAASCGRVAGALDVALASDDGDRNCGTLEVLCSSLLTTLVPTILGTTTEKYPVVPAATVSSPTFLGSTVEPLSTVMNDNAPCCGSWIEQQSNQRIDSTIVGHLSFEEDRWLSVYSRQKKKYWTPPETEEKKMLDGSVGPLVEVLAACVSRRYRRMTAFLCPSSPIEVLRQLTVDDWLGPASLAAGAHAAAAALLAQFHRDASVTNATAVIQLALAVGPLLGTAMEASVTEEDLTLSRGAYDLAAAIVTSLRGTAARFRGVLSASANLAFVRLCNVVVELARIQHPLFLAIFESLGVSKIAKQVDKAADTQTKPPAISQLNVSNIMFEDPTLYKGLPDLRSACQRAITAVSSKDSLERDLNVAKALSVCWSWGPRFQRMGLASKVVDATLHLGIAKRRLQRCATRKVDVNGGPPSPLVLSCPAAEPLATFPAPKLSTGGEKPPVSVVSSHLSSSNTNPLAPPPKMEFIKVEEDKMKAKLALCGDGKLAFLPLQPVPDGILEALVASFDRAKRCLEDIAQRDQLLADLRQIGTAVAPVFHAMNALGRSFRDVVVTAQGSKTKRMFQFQGGQRRQEYFESVMRDYDDRLTAEDELAKLRHWRPQFRDLDDVEKLSLLTDRNSTKLTMELKDARRVQSRVSDLNAVAPLVASAVLSVRLLAACLQRKVPGGLVRAAVTIAEGDGVDDMGLTTLFDGGTTDQPKKTTSTKKGTWRPEDVIAFHRKLKRDFGDRLREVVNFAFFLPRLDWPLAVVIDDEDFPDDDEMELEDASNEWFSSMAARLPPFHSGDVLETVDVVRAMDTVPEAGPFYDYVKTVSQASVISDRHWPTLQRFMQQAVGKYQKSSAAVERLVKAIQAEIHRAGVASGDRVRVARQRQGLVIAAVPQTDDDLENNQLGGDWWDPDNDDPRPSHYTVAIDDVTSNDSRYAAWGKYNWDSGYWTVSRQHLEVIWDGIDKYKETPVYPVVGYRRLDALRAELAVATVRAAEHEANALRETIASARADLVKFPDLHLEEGGALRPLAKKAVAAVRSKRRQVKALKEEVASLKYNVGATRSRILPTGDWKDPKVTTSLTAEKTCLERDLVARRRLFDAYVQDLVDHFTKSDGVPTSDWLDRTSPLPRYGQPGRYLDTAAFQRINGTDVSSSSSSKSEDEDDDDDAFVFPFGVLPRTVPNNTATTTTAEAQLPTRFDDDFFNRTRERYLWWITTWVDVTQCETCWGACPRADLLGGPGICSHVGGSCTSCVREYARGALQDAAIITERGLPCFASRTHGCPMAYDGKVLSGLKILEGSDVTKFERFVRAARIRGGDKGWCPNPDCDTVIDFAVTTSCPKCALDLCPRCRQAAHHGNCIDFFGAANLKLANDKRFQSCPQCNAVVEKAEACDHMSCPCGARFCYVCGALGHNCPTTCTKSRHFNGGGASLAGPPQVPPRAVDPLSLSPGGPGGIIPGLPHIRIEPVMNDDPPSDDNSLDDDDDDHYGSDDDDEVFDDY